ncbi:SPOR domain-containing protein [Diaphorobacter aerolatus]|uniref:SPOR domain-containing protein n=1 Tax=Diaphorobacter aerolatus TaxID=1288495 RepID=A0A7H0GGV1_9BURK|nr:SPOR domain-containing protein [Diaphorobacter aerolatus]QNP47517.1 SPOR domain-containing protein [Diaphorobacter aerolatus]
MLRIAVLVLLLANAGYYAWSQGMLRSMGWGPSVQVEPQRLNQQIEPQKMQVTPIKPGEQTAAVRVPAASTTAPATVAASNTPSAGAASSASAAAASAPATPPIPPAAASSAHVRTVCLQAGPLDEQQAQAWRSAARGVLPDSSWKLDASSVSGRWMVYIGKLADDEAVAKKRAELKTLQIDYDRPGPAFEPGLSLGRFSSEEAAQRMLTQLTGKGVRTAKVVVERKEASTYTLRLPAVDEATRARLQRDFKTALAGKPLQGCN